MKKIWNCFNNQNLGIKIGFISLVVSIIMLILGLTLIATANFIPDNTSNTDHAGYGFSVINSWGGINNFLLSSSYKNIMTSYYYSNHYTYYPLIQVSLGIICAVIISSTLMGISILTLIYGYIKRWLYS